MCMNTIGHNAPWLTEYRHHIIIYSFADKTTVGLGFQQQTVDQLDRKSSNGPLTAA